jgi:hypothetical protein
LPGFDDPVEHLTVGLVRKGVAERPGGAKQLLCPGIVQGDRCPPNFQCFAHVAVEGGEIPGLQARRYRENLQLTLYASDLAVDVAEQIFGPFLDVALDPCLFVVDGAEDGRARQSDQRQNGREG